MRCSSRPTTTPTCGASCSPARAGHSVPDSICRRRWRAEGRIGQSGRRRVRLHRRVRPASAPPVVLHNIDTPTICALNGGAAGYGLDLALGCDIRIAAENAKLNPGFAKRGILPESGGTWLLPRMVGYAKAAEIAFTGRTLSAAEALELGLVNQVVAVDEFDKRTAEMAADIAANAPLAVRAIKRMMRAAETETFEQNVHHVFLQLLPLLRTDDFTEGVRAFMEKRDPEFHGR